MRTYAHIIDTKAVKKTINAIPDHWVIRELTERDYGIDLMIEIFSQVEDDKNGHAQYDSSGRVCYLQIKGTGSKFNYDKKDKSVSFRLNKKSLLYVDKFATPFLLVRVSTEESEPIHFVWLQRYIMDVLDVEEPNWRDGEKDSFAIKMPNDNQITNVEKIEKITSRIKYIEEYTEFFETFTDIATVFKTIGEQSTLPDEKRIVSTLLRIQKMVTLLEYNEDNITSSSIQAILDMIAEIKAGDKSVSVLINYPQKTNFENFLTEGKSRLLVERVMERVTNKPIY